MNEQWKYWALKKNPDLIDRNAVQKSKEVKYNQGFYDGYTRATEQANAVIEDIKHEIAE